MDPNGSQDPLFPPWSNWVPSAAIGSGTNAYLGQFQTNSSRFRPLRDKLRAILTNSRPTLTDSSEIETDSRLILANSGQVQPNFNKFRTIPRTEIGWNWNWCIHNQNKSSNSILYAIFNFLHVLDFY